MKRCANFAKPYHKSFPYRRDSLLDLLDALSSNERAHSTVELSLNPCFRRQYSALYKSISQAYVESDYPVCSHEAYQQGAELLNTLSSPSQLPYPVFGLDETPNERLFAGCLSDRQTILILDKTVLVVGPDSRGLKDLSSPVGGLLGLILDKQNQIEILHYTPFHTLREASYRMTKLGYTPLQRTGESVSSEILPLDIPR